eukprot:CAMPEP_0174723768 /NCGR_PEP_ID=MMETSP1094-20130205/41803_1 /TAXON_ID=156173 /ORGANISM="Chrysochromulina brevifilum, Strain UTEX LB 985" /LENGTH=137 /DNA_ID=CAMNT_0015924865 /DNA_START=173 /DNA_END=583 /DNA_ORIENTATION=+
MKTNAVEVEMRKLMCVQSKVLEEFAVHCCTLAATAKYRLDDDAVSIDNDLVIWPLGATLVNLHHTVQHVWWEGTVPDVVGLSAHRGTAAETVVHCTTIVGVGAKDSAQRAQDDASAAAKDPMLASVDDGCAQDEVVP